MQIPVEARREQAQVAVASLARERATLGEDDFPSLLRRYRERTGRSRNGVAHEVGVDPSYLTRCEQGDREPPRQHIIEALARALRLNRYERNRLLVAAGYAPPSVLRMGGWDDTLQAVVDVLGDAHLSPEERDEFRDIVRRIARRWRGGEPQHVPQY